MKKIILVVVIPLIQLVSCTPVPKGNPELVKQVEKVAELGCACLNTSCLHKIKVAGKGVVAIISAKLDDLTKEEKDRFYTASKQYMACESALRKKAKK